MRLPLTQAEAAQPLAPQGWPVFPVMPDRPVAQPSEPPKPGASPRPAAEEMAKVVLDMLSGVEGDRDIAARVGVSLAELRRWREVYTEAGLRALAALR